jgi:hypothetical protein
MSVRFLDRMRMFAKAGCAATCNGLLSAAKRETRYGAAVECTNASKTFSVPQSRVSAMAPNGKREGQTVLPCHFVVRIQSVRLCYDSQRDETRVFCGGIL